MVSLSDFFNDAWNAGPLSAAELHDSLSEQVSTEHMAIISFHL